MKCCGIEQKGIAMIEFQFIGGNHYWMDDIRDVCMNWLSVVRSSCNGWAAKARYVFQWYQLKCHGIEQKGIAMIEWRYVSGNHYWMDDIRDVCMVWSGVVIRSCNGFAAKARYVFQWYRMKCCGIEQKGIAMIEIQFFGGNHYWMDDIRDVCMNWLSVVRSSCNGWSAKARYVFQWYQMKCHGIEQKGIVMIEWRYISRNHFWMDDIRDVCMFWLSVVISSCNGWAAKARYVIQWYRMKCHGIEQKGIAMNEWWYVSGNHYWIDDIGDVCMVLSSVVLSSWNGWAAKARYVFQWYRMKCHGIEQKGIATIEWQYVSGNQYWMDDIRDVCMVLLSVAISSCNGYAAKARYVIQWYRMNCHGIEQKGIAKIEWRYVNGNHYWMDDIGDVCMVWLSVVISSCNGCAAKARYISQWYRMKLCGIEQKSIAMIEWLYVSRNHYWMDDIRYFCMVLLSAVISSWNGWAAKARHVF
jgi:hypothetical protein